MKLPPITLLALAACAPGLGHVSAPAGQSEETREVKRELGRLVADLCDKEVVLLGESEHGDGRTWEIKTEVVRALVDSCGFDSLYIESGLYDFLALDRAHAAGTATSQDVASAIGAVWAEARETQPFIAYVHEAAAADRLEVMGLDDQIHSTAFYAQQELPAALAAHLPGARRDECGARIARHVQWTYDEAHPHSAESQATLQSCLEEIQAAVAKEAPSPKTSEDLAMARNLSRWVARDFVAERQAIFNTRDRSMFDNFQWQRQRSGDRGKAIVWCATIHAAKGLDEVEAYRGFSPLGRYIHQQYGERAAAIGFSAWSGASRRRGRPIRELSIAPPESLEGRVLAAEQPLRYLDAEQLRALGSVDARPMGHEFHRAAWHEVLDGLVVLRRETPAHHDVAPAAKAGSR
ncbi:erythromycin esterase family protein [Nannocystis punicea]|uniref:Erythromycin esterase family protein n=1 Tax=Nannocystis punicea TaxID=2995304 RepID=A0ABY7H9E7_9BACT|nr:erythromycin esterase family protein [Nannocystis poenicansa]WAS95763.1 erythromycin esterase family protein [Nannocystis poenicansa]